MQEETEFSALYKQLVDNNLSPDAQRLDETLQAILIQAFSRESLG